MLAEVELEKGGDHLGDAKRYIDKVIQDYQGSGYPELHEIDARICAAAGENAKAQQAREKAARLRGDESRPGRLLQL